MLCEGERKKKKAEQKFSSEGKGKERETAIELRKRVQECVVTDMGHTLREAKGFFRRRKKEGEMTKDDLTIISAFVSRLSSNGIQPYQTDILRFIFYFLSGSLALVGQPLV